MKKIISILIFLFTLICHAQHEPKFENDTLTTSTGFKVYEGLSIKIGTGSMNDGDFKFIRTNVSSLFNYYSTTGYQGLANQANSFRRSNSGLTFKVKKIMTRGTKKNGYVYYAKIGQSLINYEMDVEMQLNRVKLLFQKNFYQKQKVRFRKL